MKMAGSLETAALVRPCIVRSTVDATGAKGLLFRSSLAGSPAMVTVTLPAAAKGKYLTLLAVGCNVQYGVVLDGDTKPTLVYNQAVTAGTGHEAAGQTVVDSIAAPIQLPDNAKELVFMWAAATAGATFEGCISSARG
jgi:hypothetical protein